MSSLDKFLEAQAFEAGAASVVFETIGIRHQAAASQAQQSHDQAASNGVDHCYFDFLAQQYQNDLRIAQQSDSVHSAQFAAQLDECSFEHLGEKYASDVQKDQQTAQQLDPVLAADFLGKCKQGFSGTSLKNGTQMFKVASAAATKSAQADVTAIANAIANNDGPKAK